MGDHFNNAMQTGVVKRWFEEKGFGFISLEGRGDDVFVHRRALIGGANTLVEGNRVTFFSEFDEPKGKWKAARCSVISDGNQDSLIPAAPIMPLPVGCQTNVSKGRSMGGKGGGGGGKGGGGKGGSGGGGAPAPDAWDFAQAASLEGSGAPVDLERLRPQREVAAFPAISVAADWPPGQVPRSGSAFYLPLIWTALVLDEEGGGDVPPGVAAARHQLESLGDAKHFHNGAARRAALEDILAAQAYWRQVFSAWDGWVLRLRAAMAGADGGLAGVVERFVRKTSVTACALVYGDLRALGALPHISNARNSPHQDSILELDLMLRVEVEASIATLFAPPLDAALLRP